MIKRYATISLADDADGHNILLAAGYPVIGVGVMILLVVHSLNVRFQLP